MNNVPDSLDPNIQNSQQIFSFDNRLNTNADEEAVIFDKLKEDIKEEEDIAMKSALLLQLLEVGLVVYKINRIIKWYEWCCWYSVSHFDLHLYNEMFIYFVLFYSHFLLRSQPWVAHYHLYMSKISPMNHLRMIHCILQKSGQGDITVDTHGSVKITNIVRK